MKEFLQRIQEKSQNFKDEENKVLYIVVQITKLSHKAAEEGYDGILFTVPSNKIILSKALDILRERGLYCAWSRLTACCSWREDRNNYLEVNLS